MSVEKIGKIEAIALIIIIMINSIILNVPNIIILTTESGTSLNIIFISILAIAFTYIIYKLFKPFLGKDILDISEYVGGNVLKTIVGILFIIFFMLVAALSVKFFANFLKLLYFNKSPIIYLLMFFLIPALFINKLGIKAISGVNLIFFPIAILSLIFLLSFSYNRFSIEKIFPILGNGFFNTFVYGATNISAFSGLAYLYFIPSLLKNAKDFKKVSMASIIISGIFLVFSIISLMMSFSAVATTNETLSLYLLTRMIKFGYSLEKLDTIFIFIWILSIFSYTSINLFYSLKIFKKISNIEDSGTLIYPLGLIILGLCLVFKSTSIIQFFAKIICKYYILRFSFWTKFYNFNYC